MKTNVFIRAEQPGDITAIRTVNERAFRQPHEADIVDALRKNCPDTISLVAESSRMIVGHIFFSPVSIEGAEKQLTGMGLAPMAVNPDEQKHGIGTRLIKAGLEILHKRNYPFVVVLGYPAYYRRFGFVPASQYGLKCQWEGVPDDALMVLLLDQAFSSKLSGVVRYRDEFNIAM